MSTSNYLVVIVAEPLKVPSYHGWLSSAIQAGRRRATTISPSTTTADHTSDRAGHRQSVAHSRWSRRHRHRTSLLFPRRYSLFALRGICTTVGGLFAAIARGIGIAIDSAATTAHTATTIASAGSVQFGSVGHKRTGSTGGNYHHIAARERIRR